MCVEPKKVKCAVVYVPSGIKKCTGNELYEYDVPDDYVLDYT